MRVKEYLLISVILLASGCADAKRFLPPGFVKYEDLAKGRPIDEEINTEIRALKDNDDAKFPRLSRQPSEPPDSASSEVRSARMDELVRARDHLEAAIEADNQSATAERAADLHNEPPRRAPSAAEILLDEK